MKLEELIIAIDKSTLDEEASAEIVEILIDKLLENRSQKKEYFTVLETCKEDMTFLFKTSQETLAKIDKLTNKQIEKIAADVGDQLFDPYWKALKLAMKAELEAGK